MEGGIGIEVEIGVGVGVEIGVEMEIGRACQEKVEREVHDAGWVAALLEPVAPPWKPWGAHAPRGFQKGSSTILRSSSTLDCGAPTLSASIFTAVGILEHFHAL